MDLALKIWRIGFPIFFLVFLDEWKLRDIIISIIVAGFWPITATTALLRKLLR